MAVEYITFFLLTLISCSMGSVSRQELEDKLMQQEKTIDTLLRLLQQPCYLINPRQARHNGPRSIMAMTVQQRMADVKGFDQFLRNPMLRIADRKVHNHHPDSKDSKNREVGTLPFKENKEKKSKKSHEKTGPGFDNNFYKALSKVLRMEINRRPELRKIIGEDIDKINIGDPDIY